MMYNEKEVVGEELIEVNVKEAGEDDRRFSVIILEGPSSIPGVSGD